MTDFAALQGIVHALRNARAEYNVDPGRKIPCILYIQRESLFDLLSSERGVFAMLGRVNETTLQIVHTPTATIPTSESPAATAVNITSTLAEVVAAGPCVHLVIEDGVSAYLPQSGLLDPEKERLRLNKQAEKLRKAIETIEVRLNSGFAERAPANIVTDTRNSLRDIQDQLGTVENSLAALPLAPQ